MIKPTFRREIAAGHGYNGFWVAGIDEVGRGPLAGPVTAAAVIFPAKGPSPQLARRIKDSKQLRREIRAELKSEIEAESLAFAVGHATVAEIDEINILQASMRAMRRAMEALSTKPGHLLIDGNHLPRDLPCSAEAIIDGDALCLSIAAASILAKEERDAIMRALHIEYPGYGWESNVGYPTRQHFLSLRELGPTPHHRRSFAPVKEALSSHPAPAGGEIILAATEPLA